MVMGDDRRRAGDLLGFTPREPEPVVTGRRAYVQWWERLRAAVVLAALVVLMGLATAALVGIALFAGGFLLEQIVS
jgi:hypothetical protein